MSARNVETIYPVAPQQLGFLAESLAGGYSGIHIEQEVFELGPGFEPALLRAAWQDLVAAQPILRTAFAWKGREQPLQVVLREVPAELPDTDWRTLPAEQQERRLDLFLEEDRRRGFELNRPPLLRLHLFRRSDEEWWLTRTLHHVLLDGWSVLLLNRAFHTAYAVRAGREATQAAAAPPYRDYVAWVGRQDREAAAAFWRRTLATPGPPTPPGRPDEEEAAPAGSPYSVLETSLPADASARLQEAARRQRVTMSAAAQALWAILLSRYSGEWDVTFGYTASGRPAVLPEVDAMIGLFSNSLPLRTRLDPAEPFWELVRRVHQTTVAQRPYEWCPTGLIHAAAGLPGARPLFDSLLVYENYPPNPPSPAPGFELRDIRHTRAIGAQTAYALTLLVIQRDALLFRLIRRTDRLGQEAAERIARSLPDLAACCAEGNPVTAELLAAVPETEIPRFHAPGPVRAGAAAPPADPIEATLCRIWAALLGLERVGPEESFLALGGHSLLATQAASRIREELGVVLPLQVLFEAPSARSLAPRIEAAPGRADTAADAGSIPPAPRDRPLPLSFAQQRLWFMEQLEPGRDVFHSPFGYRIAGPLHAEALKASLDAIVQRHEALRTGFRGGGEAAEQVVQPPAPLPLPIVDLSSLGAGAEAEAARQAQAAMREPFDLARGPLLRAILYRIGADQHRLLLVLHHIASDGWSLGVLHRELGAHYRAALCDSPALLPALPIQYADFAAWQRSAAARGEFDAQAEAWRRRLGDRPTRWELPGRCDPGHPEDYRGERIPCPAVENARVPLAALAGRTGATPFMVYLAALFAALHARTGSTDISLGTDVAGRNRLELEPLIGFFVNHLVLRVDLSGNPSFSSLVERVREVALEAFAGQDVSFDRLVELLNPERRSGSSPLFQVLFVMQNAPMAMPDLPWCRVEWWDPGRTLSRYDLSLFLEETPSGLAGHWLYRTALFGRPEVESLAAAFARILAATAADPDLRLSTLAAAPRTPRGPSPPSHRPAPRRSR